MQSSHEYHQAVDGKLDWKTLRKIEHLEAVAREAALLVKAITSGPWVKNYETKMTSISTERWRNMLFGNVEPLDDALRKVDGRHDTNTKG